MENEGNQRNQEKQAKRKWNDTLPALYIVTLILLGAGFMLGSLIYLIPVQTASDAYQTALLYLMFIGVWVVYLLYMRFTKKNRYILSKISHKSKNNNWKYFVYGFLMVFAMNGFCILAAWWHKDISLSFKAFHPVSFVLIFVTVFIQSSADELFSRGFLYQRLRRSYQNPLVAIIGNSVFFACYHLICDEKTVLSIINLFIFAIFFSVVVYYTDSIWFAMAGHTAWNFTQSIVFGLPNSGTVLPYYVFQLDTTTVRNSFAYDVGFGIEGGILASIVLIAGCVMIYIFRKQYGVEEGDVRK